MMVINKIKISFAVLATLALFFLLKPAKLASAPNIDLVTLKGKTLNPSNLNNKPALITFWASSCKTCVLEIPELGKLHQDYHKLGFNVIAIAMYYDRPDKVSDIIKLYNIPYHIVFDLQKNIMRSFGMKQGITPTTFLVSPKGKIVFHKLGKLNFDDLRQQIDSLLIENKP